MLQIYTYLFTKLFDQSDLVSCVLYSEFRKNINIVFCIYFLDTCNRTNITIILEGAAGTLNVRVKLLLCFSLELLLEVLKRSRDKIHAGMIFLTFIFSMSYNKRNNLRSDKKEIFTSHKNRLEDGKIKSQCKVVVKRQYG